MRNTFDYGNIRNYQSALNLVEIFDLTIMELQAHLRNPLCTLLLTEPDARQAQILSQSPFDERNIRSEVYDFIEEKVDGSEFYTLSFSKASVRSFPTVLYSGCATIRSSLSRV